MPFTVASPLKLQSSSVYSVLLARKSYSVTVFSVPSYFSLPLRSVIVTVTLSVIGVTVSVPSTFVMA